MRLSNATVAVGVALIGPRDLGSPCDHGPKTSHPYIQIQT